MNIFQARARWVVGPLLAALLVALTACAGTTTGGTTATPTTPATATATATVAPTAVVPTATTTPTTYPVKVYFSKHPDSDNDVNKTFPVSRVSPTLGVATYAIGQLFAGPTATEQARGYYTPWAGIFTGASNCGGPTFKITLDHRGTTPAPGVATLQLCKETQLPGDLAGARAEATADATLLQFSNIKKVVILNWQGACFNDLSGLNLCLSSS